MSYKHTKWARALTFVATVRPRRSFEFAVDIVFRARSDKPTDPPGSNDPDGIRDFDRRCLPAESDSGRIHYHRRDDEKQRVGY
jgi:hypothetical protein